MNFSDLTAWNKALLEKLVDAQPVEKLSEFCETKKVYYCFCRSALRISDLSQINPAHILSNFNGLLYFHFPLIISFK